MQITINVDVAGFKKLFTSKKFIVFVGLFLLITFLHADSTILPHTFADGDILSASQLNENFGAITNVINGNITDANISDTANISQDKIAGSPFAPSINYWHKELSSSTSTSASDAIISGLELYVTNQYSTIIVSGSIMTFASASETRGVRIYIDGSSAHSYSLGFYGKNTSWDTLAFSYMLTDITPGAHIITIRSTESTSTSYSTGSQVFAYELP